MELTELITIYLILMIPGILIGFQIGVNFWHYWLMRNDRDYFTELNNQSKCQKANLPTIWRWLHRR
jgi:hypothetical protein